MDTLGIPTAQFSLTIIALSIILSFFLQLAIIWVYRKTHRGLSYSSSFLFTLVIIGVVGTMVMMVVRENIIGAFALLGAFSLIRFRTIVKETRDIAFVFLSLTSGVAVGTSNYDIAILGTVLILGIVFLMDRYGAAKGSSALGFIINFNLTDKSRLSEVRQFISGHSTSHQLLQARSYDGEGSHYVFSVRFKDDSDASRLLEGLRNLSSISNPELITGSHSVEY